MELAEAGIIYSFEETATYNKYKYMRVFKGKEIDVVNIWVRGWHYEFLQLLTHWNRNIDEWKYIEVLTW